jgi:type VI secretion system protein ImpA
MPLHVWLRRVIKDDMVLNQMEEMLDLDQNRDGQ